jgi:hypothetical protein
MEIMNVYKSNGNRIVLVGVNPTLGYTYATYLVSNDTIKREAIYSTPSAKLFDDFVTDVFDKPKGKFISTSSKIELLDDLNLISVVKLFKTRLLKDKSQDLTLEEYLNANFDIKFELKDLDVKTLNTINKNALNSNLAWSGILEEEKSSFSNYGLSDALYNEIVQSDTFKLITAYIDHIDPVSPYKNILLKGPRAAGKTTLVQAVAKYYNLPYAVMTATARKTSDDIAGMLAPNENGGWMKEQAYISKVLQAGGVAFIDELNMSNYDFQVGGLNSILDGSRFFTFYNNAFKVHNQTIFFAAMNEGYQGNKILNESTESRFFPVYMDKLSITQIASYQSKELGEDYHAYYNFVDYLHTFSQELSTTFAPFSLSPYPPEIHSRLFSKIFNLSKTLSFSFVMEQMTRSLLSDTCYPEEEKSLFLSKHAGDFKVVGNSTLFIDPNVTTQANDLLKNVMSQNETTVQLDSVDSEQDMINKAKNEVNSGMSKFKEALGIQ